MVSKNLFRLTSPFNQNLIVGLILFCEPGLYAALTGLGAGGGKPSSTTVANQTNAILYGLFALSAWFAGPCVNILKPRWSLVIGAIGYPLYVAGLWYYDRTAHRWFPLWAGAMLGLFCGLLLTTAAYVQFAYPEERMKGRYISIQFMMKAFGSFVGALIAFGASHNKLKAVGVSTAVYSVFVAIQCGAILIALLLIVDPKRVVRNDGRSIATFKHPDVKMELKNLGKAFVDKRILILTPAMLVSEMPLAMVSTINSHYFNLRTRSLNNMCFQIVGILVPAVLILVLDSSKSLNRRRRGAVGTILMTIFALGACIGLYIWIYVVHYDNIDFKNHPPAVDWSSNKYAGIIVVYLLFGIVFIGYQVVLEWLLAALTNDPSILAQFAGMVKGTQSFGMCISFVVAGQGVPLVGQLSIVFGLYITGSIGMLWLNYHYVKDTNYFTEADVTVPAQAEEVLVGKEIINTEEHPKQVEANLK